MIKSSEMVSVYHQRLQSITEALDILSSHFSVEIKRDRVNDCRGDVYKEIDHFVGCYLKEYYKHDPHIKINIE